MCYNLFMKRNLTQDKTFWCAFVYFCIAVVAIGLFIYRICTWTWQDWFFKPQYFNPYTVVNVVSRWADFAYLTYIAQLLFCIWAILRFFAVAFDSQRLLKFTNNSYVVLFVCINQFFVMVAYTLTQLIPGQNFGFYATDAYAIWSFTTNILTHYGFTTAAIVYFFLHEHNKIQFRKTLLFLPFFAVYAVIVKVTGMYCYVFEWYPYPFFSAESIWFNMFGTLDNFNATYANLIIALAIALVFAIYVLFLFLASKYVNKKAK